MNTANRTIELNKRAEYMAGTISHADYYLWLAEFIGASRIDVPVSDERLLKSTDEYLNDTPIEIWDNQDYVVRKLAYAKGLPWSLSDTVCVLKAIAKQRQAELRG
jgi:hypothetical protein